MPLKIFVGYRTRPVDNVNELTPAFAANRSLKDEAKIKADLEEKQRLFGQECRNQPYTGTFDEVVLIDGQTKKVLPYMHPSSGGNKQPISLRVRNYLVSTYDAVWSWDTHHKKGDERPTLVFYGFAPRTFLKMLGIECSLPRIGKPCPPKLWYSNVDHRDIEEAVIPHDFAKRLTWDIVLKERRPTDPEDGAKWDALVKEWKGPGNNPEMDAKLCVELATQLGFMHE